LEMLKNIWDFLNVNEGALMVVITFVYVIATIFICFFNGCSAKATHEQVSESQRQYEQTKRLEYRPYFDVATVDDSFENNLYDSEIQLLVGNRHAEEFTLLPEWIMMKNIGAGTATNLTYSWKKEKCEDQTGEFPFSTLEKGGTKTVGLHIQVELLAKYTPYQAQSHLILAYHDLLENKYEQEVVFDFNVLNENNTEIKIVKVSAPKFVN